MNSIDKYIKELRMNNKAERTIKKEYLILKQLYRFFDGDLEDMTKDDITDFIISFTEQKESTQATRKMVVRKFYRWLGKPEVVNHLKVQMPKSDIDAKDIMTAEDVNKQIEATESHLYKALISILWESGARIGELTSLILDDFEENDKGLIVSIPTYKTKNGAVKVSRRKMLLIFSAQYIRNYFLYSNKKNDERVFDLHFATIRKNLRAIREKVGIMKKNNPHAFRHAQATHMVKDGWQEAIIRKKMGWTATSPMIAVYQHLIDDDVIEAQLMMAGEDADRARPKNIDMAEPVEIVNIDLAMQKLIMQNDYLVNMVLESGKSMEKMQDRITELEYRSGSTKVEEIRPDTMPTTDKSVEKIKEVVKNFDPVEAEKKYLEDKAKEKASVSEPKQ